MRPGSVIVDLAADAGGNVEGTVAGESVVKHGVTIIGAANLARSLAADASALFARNLYNFLSAFWDKEQARPVLPDDDEIVKGIRLTQGGKVVNERLDRRLRRCANRRHPRHRRRDRRPVGRGGAVDARAGHRPRGRGADRLPLVGPKRDHAPLCARRPAGPRADARQPAVLRRSARRVQRRSARPSDAGAGPRARGRARGARRARGRASRRSPSSSGSMRAAFTSFARC